MVRRVGRIARSNRHAAAGERWRSPSSTSRRRASGRDVCGLYRLNTLARLPAGRGWMFASGAGSISARRASAPAARLMCADDQARASSAQTRRMCGDDVPNVVPSSASRKSERSRRRITAEADVDGVEEGIRRRLGEQRKDVGEGLPGAPGGIGVGVLGDSTDHALGMLLAGGPVVEPLVGDVSTEERHRVRDARPQPGRVGPRLADDGGHEPALSGDIERGIVLLEDHGPRPRGTGSGWSW